MALTQNANQCTAPDVCYDIGPNDTPAGFSSCNITVSGSIALEFCGIYGGGTRSDADNAFDQAQQVLRAGLPSWTFSIPLLGNSLGKLSATEPGQTGRSINLDYSYDAAISYYFIYMSVAIERTAVQIR
jgi:hypothetical protein